MLSADIVTQGREVYGAIDYLGDLGGVKEILMSIFGFFGSYFSARRMDALMTNRLYHVAAESQDIIGGINEAVGDKETNKLRKRPNGDIEVDVPIWLDWELAYHKLCCCFRKKEFVEYEKVIDLGVENLTGDFDICRFVRKNRMHGFGLHFKLNQALRASAARLAFSRPLLNENDLSVIQADPTDINAILDKWFYVENLNAKDYFLVALIKRYSKVLYETLDKPKIIAYKEEVKRQQEEAALLKEKEEELKKHS